MSSHLTPLDISNMPELARIAAAVGFSSDKKPEAMVKVSFVNHRVPYDFLVMVPEREGDILVG